MKRLTFFVFLLMCFFNARTQNELYTVIVGDTVELRVTGAHGDILWQESNDSLIWSDMSGLTDSIETFVVIVSPTGKKFYRPKISNPAICIPSPWYGSIIRQRLITSITELQIGDWFQGGIVFYTDGAGHWLIAPQQDQSTLTQWGCYAASIPGAASITDGASNTSAIVAFHDSFPDFYVNPEQCHSLSDGTVAAKVCDTLALNGYSDWFLPAKDQLNYLRLQRTIIGGFTSGGYWSSSQYDPGDAWEQYFSNGYQYSDGKFLGRNVRCIRSFLGIAEKTFCLSVAADPYNVYQNEKICLVTVDTILWKNIVMWEKTQSVGTASFNVFKEVGLNTDSLIGSVPYDSASYFIDYFSVPESNGDKYKITAVDTCGSFSAKSPFHKTMFLDITIFGNIMSLSWTPYEDESGMFIPDQYYIYRGLSLSNMQLLDSVSGSYTSYNDNNVFDTYYYMVSVRKPGGCNMTGNNTESFSNKKLNFGSGVNDHQIKSLSIYPNPTNDKLNINLEEKATLEIINAQGQIVDSKSLTEKTNNLDISNLVSGVYTLRIKTDRGIAIRKLIKQ